MFYRPGLQCICYLCALDEHKGHNTVSAVAEKTGRQSELKVSRQNIEKVFQDTEEDVKALPQELEDINRCADEAVEDSEEIFTQLIHLMEKQCSDVKQQEAVAS